MKKIYIFSLALILSGCTITNPLIKDPQITSFNLCQEAGFPVTKTNPQECHYQGQIFIQEPTNPDIKVDSLKSNQVISSPLTITGQAKGTWFFEASFPVTLVDSQGEIMAQAVATTKKEWMTENFISFSATLEYVGFGGTNPGTIIFEKNNPSDNRELDDQLLVPVFY
jgi:hypothetical protein